MKEIFNLLCNIFNTISFNYNEDTDNTNSWSFIDFRETPEVNYTNYELYLAVKFVSFLDFIELISPTFKAYMQDNGISITDITYRANSNTAEFRLYLTQDNTIE